MIREVGLSIITPVFRGETTILRMLRSVDAAWRVSAEGGENLKLELIIVLDGVDPQVAEIIAQFRPNSGLPIEVATKEHSGVSATRNRGLSMAKYTHVTFLDCDDEVTHDRLRWASRHESHIVIGLQEVVFDVPAPVPAGVVISSAGETERSGYILSMIAPVERILELDGFDENAVPSEDLDLLLRLKEAGMEVEFVHEDFVKRHVTGRNISAEPAKAKAALFRVLRAHKDRKA
jgi:glycosyltransferase involved in cell wall biosynthesis